MSSRQSSDDSNSCGEDDATQMNHADTRRTEDKKGPEGLQTDGIQSESFERSKTDAGASTTFVQKRGLIYKLGGKVKSWKLRYFVLHPGYFCYYKDPSVLKPIGEVKLKNVAVTESDHTAKGKQPFQFTVHTESTWNNRCDWVLAAVKEEELQDWITAFRLAGQRR